MKGGAYTRHILMTDGGYHRWQPASSLQQASTGWKTWDWKINMLSQADGSCAFSVLWKEKHSLFASIRWLFVITWKPSFLGKLWVQWKWQNTMLITYFDIHTCPFPVPFGCGMYLQGVKCVSGTVLNISDKSLHIFFLTWQSNGKAGTLKLEQPGSTRIHSLMPCVVWSKLILLFKPHFSHP